MGNTEKLEGFRRLENFTRRIEEQCDPRADFGAAVTHEFAISKRYGGRSVFDDAKIIAKKQPKKSLQAQRRLFDF
jgi:hypothetical protein